MIEISFKGDTPLEALSKAAAFGLHAAEDQIVLNAAKQIMAAEKHARVQAPVFAENAHVSAPVHKPAPAVGTPAKTPTPAVPGPDPAAEVPETAESGQTAPPIEETPTAPVPSAEEVRTKGIEASHKYGTAAIKPILQKFHVSRITEIAEKDRVAFLARLEGLGEDNA